MREYTRLNRVLKEFSRDCEDFKPLADAVRKRDYDGALKLIKSQTQYEHDGRRPSSTYSDKQGNNHNLLDMEKIVLKEKDRTGTLAYAFGMTVTTVLFIGNMVLCGLFTFDKNFKEKHDPYYAAKTQQVQMQDEYTMKPGDNEWAVVKQKYPQLSDSQLYRFIDDVVSPANGKGNMADYSLNDTSKASPHLWHAGELMKIPHYKL